MTQIHENTDPQNHELHSAADLAASIVDAILLLASALQTTHGGGRLHAASKPSAKVRENIKPEMTASLIAGLSSHLDDDTMSYSSRYLASDDKLGSLWRPGRELSVYIAGSQGTARLSRLLQRRAISSDASKGNVFKIGTAVPSRIEKRLRELCNQQYGAVEGGSNPPRLEAGFDTWRFRKICGIGQDKVPFFVKVMPEEWRITLPASMTAETFEAELRARLDARSLRTWAQTPIGRAYLRDRDIDPRVCDRESHFGSGFAARRSPSTELYLFDPKTELPQLMAIIQTIIEEHVASGTRDRYLANI